MKLLYTKAFLKGMRKLSRENQSRVDAALTLFQNNPFDPLLHNHKLQGMMEGMRSITAGYDLRIVYCEKENHLIVLLVDVGPHERVY